MTKLVGATSEEFEQFTTQDAPLDSSTEHAVAIAWVIDRAAERLLLLRHRTHGWSCPGGHVEGDETPLAAASRELTEETGLTANPLSPDPFVVVRTVGCPRAPGGDVIHWAFGFRFEASSTDSIRTEPGQPGRWFPFTGLPHDRADDIDDVLRQLELG